MSVVVEQLGRSFAVLQTFGRCHLLARMARLRDDFSVQIPSHL